MRLLVLLVVAVSMVMAGCVTIKTLVFPTATSTSLVEIFPLKPLQLQAFTLCMNVALESQTPPGRDVILFAYRTTNDDELNAVPYLTGEGVLFALPQLGALETHLCITWESGSGATSFFLNGRKSLAKIYRQGHVVQSGGKAILGQDADSYLGGF
ncbi:hypothetical protein INR49_011598 [Caranx melampygus]|nr:hypothetical protein INR49_011598 [Caranx melampygus]